RLLGDPEDPVLRLARELGQQRDPHLGLDPPGQPARALAGGAHAVGVRPSAVGRPGPRGALPPRAVPARARAAARDRAVPVIPPEHAGAAGHPLPAHGDLLGGVPAARTRAARAAPQGPSRLKTSGPRRARLPTLPACPAPLPCPPPMPSPRAIAA